MVKETKTKAKKIKKIYSETEKEILIERRNEKELIKETEKNRFKNEDLEIDF